MALLEIREADCPPEVLANLVFSCLLFHNSAPESMPFLFPDYLEETAELHVRFLVKYLSSAAEHQAERPLKSGLFFSDDIYPLAIFWFLLL